MECSDRRHAFGRGRRTARGQALVESALTLPMMIFLILGSLQMFLAQHARYVAEVAVFRAARAGAVSRGDCERMLHSAIGALMPSITRVLKEGGATPQEKLANGFKARKNNHYNPWLDRAASNSGGTVGYTGTIVWLDRSLSRPLDFTDSPTGEDLSFDSPGRQLVMSTELTFWFPLKLPFVRWVIWKIVMARWTGVVPGNQNAASALMATQTQGAWAQAPQPPAGDIVTTMAALGSVEQYMLPIRTSFAMRMLTPPKLTNFDNMQCAPH